MAARRDWGNDQEAPLPALEEWGRGKSIGRVGAPAAEISAVAATPVPGRAAPMVRAEAAQVLAAAAWAEASTAVAGPRATASSAGARVRWVAVVEKNVGEVAGGGKPCSMAHRQSGGELCRAAEERGGCDQVAGGPGQRGAAAEQGGCKPGGSGVGGRGERNLALVPSLNGETLTLG